MTVFDYIINIYECLIMALFLYTWHSENKDHILVRSIIYFFAEFTFITFINQFSPTESILFIVDVILCFFYVFSISDMKWYSALLIAPLPSLIFGFSNSLYQILITLLFQNHDYFEIVSMYRIPVLTIINLIHGVLFYYLQKWLHSFHMFLKTSDSFLIFLILVTCMLITNAIHTVLITETNTSFFLMLALIFSLLLCVLAVIVMIRINKQSHIALEKEHEAQLIMQDQMNAEQRMEAEQQLYKLTHDVKHFMRLIDADYFSENPELKQKSEEIEKQIGTSISSISTPSKPITFVLNLKSEEALKKNIDFKCMINMTKDIDMDEADLYLVLSNVLDNAIKHIGVYKKIEVIIRERNDMCVMEISNSIDHPVETDAKENIKHGYGIPTINRIMERYDYTVHYSQTDMIFTVKMLFKSVSHSSF